jgi:hypothetical protein
MLIIALIVRPSLVLARLRNHVLQRGRHNDQDMSLCGAKEHICYGAPHKLRTRTLLRV